MIRKRKGDISMEELYEMEYQEPPNEEREFQELIEPLQEQDRSIFTLHYVYGLKVKEIAACMEMNENTVVSRMKRGRETLRIQMTKTDGKG